jgi:hypothetical protein
MSSSVSSTLGSFAIFKISLISYYRISIVNSGSDSRREDYIVSIESCYLRNCSHILVEIVGAASLFCAVEDNYRSELVHITSPYPRIK